MSNEVREEESLSPTRWPAWVGYLVTIPLEVALTVGLILLQAYLPLASFPIPYILLIMLVAYLFGEGPAILAFLAGLFAYDYFFIPPYHTIMPHPETPAGWASIIAYLMGALIVGLFTIQVRRSRQRIQQVAEDLRESRERLLLSTEVGGIGIWCWDILRNYFIADDKTKALFGLSHEAEATYELLISKLHPEDRQRVEEAIHRAIDEHTDYDTEYRVICPGGRIGWLLAEGRTYYNASGNPMRMLGTVIDITERKRAEEAMKASEQRFRSLVEQSPFSTQIFSPDGHMLYANPAFRRLWHATPEAIEYLVQHYRILEDKQLETKGVAPYIKRAFAGEPVRIPPIEYEIEPLDEQLGATLGLKNTWVRGYVFPTKDGEGNIREVVLTHEDVTAQVRAEGSLKARARQQAAVADLGQRALAGIDLNTLMDEAVVSITESLDLEYSMVMELLPDGKALLLRAGVGWKQGLIGTETVSAGSESQAGYTLTAKEPVITYDLPTETRFKRTPLLVDHGVVSGVNVIIQYGERPYGILGAHTTERREFTEEDVHFLQGIANVLAMGIQRTQAEEALRKLNRTLKTLSQVNQILVRASEESSLLNEVCQAIVDIGGYRMAWIGYAEQDAEKTVRPVAFAGYEDGYLQTVKMTWADNELGRGPAGTGIRTGRPSFANDIAADAAYIPWREEALKREYASSVSMPLIANGQTLGTLNLYAGEPRAFDEEEVHLLTELAGDLAYGVASLRTREQRRQAEDALRDSEERYRSLIDLSPDAILVHSEGVLLFANQAAAALLHAANPDELIDRPVLSFVHPDYHDIVRQRIWQVAEENKKGPMLEETFLTLDGSTVDVEIVNMPVTFQGKVAVLTVARDISERKMAEQRRLEMEEHKREFYRRTILAATEEKLEITERGEIERIAGPPIASWEIRQAGDLAFIRKGIADIAESAGMEDSRVYDFVLAAGEATTNAIKHAGAGTVSIHRKDNGLLLVVSDRGPGIEALALPDVALKRGYTTAVSLGMGYKAIISIADKVYLATGPDGTTVAIEMKPHAPMMSAIGRLPDTWK